MATSTEQASVDGGAASHSAVDVVDLDTRGLHCPLPLIRTKRAIGLLLPGQRLRVLTTDPQSLSDFRRFAAQTGHSLLAQELVQAGEWAHTLQRRAGSMPKASLGLL